MRSFSSRLSDAWAAVRAELRRGRVRTSEPRGVALLIVLMTMAIMTAFAAEFHYKSYIRLHVAANQRDETIAYFHARAAMEVARLVIADTTLFGGLLGQSRQAGVKNKGIEPWTLACEFANAFCSGELKLLGRDFLDMREMGGVGVEEGGFCKCRAKPEDGRTNINRVDDLQGKQQVFGDLYSKMIRFSGKELLPGEFDDETAEMVLNIIDWADSDKNATQVANGRLVESAQPEGGFGKDYPIKNAKFDTLAEIQQVDDVTPDMYCAIANELTPYATEKLNVSQADLNTLFQTLCPENVSNMLEACYTPVEHLTLVGPMAFTPVQTALGCVESCRTIRQALYSPGFASLNQFYQVFQKLPGRFGPRPALNTSALNARLGTKSKVIRIETVGGSYGTYKALTSVLDTSVGSYVYWREY
ncbi:MAG: type II secretory pathway component PulK [Myxococcota bacterium]|jgi:type II secretory pathway component PulK